MLKIIKTWLEFIYDYYFLDLIYEVKRKKFQT